MRFISRNSDVADISVGDEKDLFRQVAISSKKKVKQKG
jgi:hypothetical protein